MTAIKTQIGANTAAQQVTHAPTSSIPKSNTWDAIKYVYDTLLALLPPVSADYLVKTANATLTAERVVTDGTSITADWSTPGQVTLKRAALTGDVAASADANATTIANDAVTFAKMQNIATDRLVGRDTASSGDPEELTVGGGLEFTGSGGIQRAALTGDVAASAGSGTTAIANDAVTNAKLRDSAAVSVIGRSANSSGDPADIAAASNDTLLRRVADVIEFGALTLGMAAANLWTNAKLAQMAQSTIKGRAAGAGTGDPTDLTATEATAILNNMVGDSGSGGTKGLVPAPAAGDAAASKFLKADGTWAAGGGFTAATQAEQEAGSSTTVGTTPGRQKYHPSACKAWIKFDASSGTPTSSINHNVSSLTDNGAGDTTVNFTTAFSTANYAVLASNFTVPGTGLYMLGRENSSATATGSCRVSARVVNPTTGALTDVAENYYAFFGDQ